MVRFNEGKLIIEIECCTNDSAVETWRDICSGLLHLLYFETSENISNDTHFRVIQLLEEIVPDFDLAKKMIL